MTAHTTLKTLAFAAAAALSLVVGCGSSPGETTGQSNDDLKMCGPDGCNAPPDTYVCYGGYTIGASGLEGALRALGCSDKRLWSSNGGGTGWFQVTCPETTSASLWCPATGVYQTMGAATVASCYQRSSPYYSSWSNYSNCSSTAQGFFVAYDPTCGGTHCGLPW